MAVRFPFFLSAPLAGFALIVTVTCASGCAEGQTLPPPEPKCGDGERQGDELCDDGADNSDTRADACRTSCSFATCGDGVVDGGEECDDGNAASHDGCSATCVTEFVCGDRTCEVARGESCALCADDCCVCGDMECTAAFGETCESCPGECCPACGNGALDGGEACDDGNHVAGDGCSPGCQDEDGQPTCGNGVLEAGEVCDDGNVAEHDGCSPACQVEFVCGDGACDTMNGESCRGCRQDCCPDCGNGAIDDGEECDAAALGGLTCEDACYDGGALGCTAWCAYDFAGCTGTLPMCGDGVAACDEACDGDDLSGATCESVGYSGGALACDAACALDTSACSARVVYLDQDFDGGCLSSGFTLGGDWECGAPTSVGPAAAYSAPACIGTQIDANYSVNQSFTTAVATTPAIDISAANEPVLVYRAWVNTEGGSADGYNVKISANGGATYSLLTNVTPAYDLTAGGESAWGGNQSALGWQEVTVDLGTYVGNTVLLRFAFRSDGSTVRPGVYIDDVRVAERAAALPLAIATPAALPDAFTTQPYATQLARSGGSSAAAWSITGGTHHAWLSIDAATGALSGTPAVGDVGAVSVTVRIAEPTYPSNFSERTFSLAVVNAVYQTSFEGACPGGWTLTGDWECGVPTTGPSSAFEGTQCIATQIDANYSGSQRFATTTATSPSISLAGVTAPRLSFRMWLNTEMSYDGAHLKISRNGGAFQLLTGLAPGYNASVSGQSAWSGDQSSLGWRLFTADLAAYAGQNIQLQFAFNSDLTSAFPGVYVDDLRVLR
jgi:cysteine-rich repeat protein